MIRIFSFILLITFFSCKEKRKPDVTQEQLQEPLVKANQQRVKDEAILIDSYVKRRGWDMKETGTGLRYMIYSKGAGSQAQPGQVAIIKFKVSLLDGTECYSSENSGPQEFRIGQDNVESGLHEAILLMHVGDKARFILPPHLAYGLIGDQQKIPALSTILYDVELVGLR